MKGGSRSQYKLPEKKISAACKKGKHGQCFVVECACKNCNHNIVGRSIAK